MKSICLTIVVIMPLILFAQKRPVKKARATAGAVTNKAEKFEPVMLYFVMLKKGNNRTQDSTTAERIQEGYMANITRLSKEGKLLVAGPFMEDKDWRGIFILKTASLEEAEQLVKTDPAVVSGRLSYEIVQWMTGKNCLFK